MKQKKQCVLISGDIWNVNSITFSATWSPTMTFPWPLSDLLRTSSHSFYLVEQDAVENIQGAQHSETVTPECVCVWERKSVCSAAQPVHSQPVLSANVWARLWVCSRICVCVCEWEVMFWEASICRASILYTECKPLSTETTDSAFKTPWEF